MAEPFSVQMDALTAVIWPDSGVSKTGDVGTGVCDCAGGEQVAAALCTACSCSRELASPSGAFAGARLTTESCEMGGVLERSREEREGTSAETSRMEGPSVSLSTKTSRLSYTGIIPVTK